MLWGHLPKISPRKSAQSHVMIPTVLLPLYRAFFGTLVKGLGSVLFDMNEAWQGFLVA